MSRQPKTPADVASEPFTAAQIARHLRDMPDAALAAVTPGKFRVWPVRKIVPDAVISELISNERANRRSA